MSDPGKLHVAHACVRDLLFEMNISKLNTSQNH